MGLRPQRFRERIRIFQAEAAVAASQVLTLLTPSQEAQSRLFQAAEIKTSDSNRDKGIKFLRLLNTLLETNKAHLELWHRFNDKHMKYKVIFSDYPEIKEFYIERISNNEGTDTILVSMDNQRIDEKDFPRIKGKAKKARALASSLTKIHQ